MKITVLTENTSACGLPYEHGLSLYIEANGHRLLFDTGQTALFSENAEQLGVDLAAVDICVLSHGHYDHGGGLKRFIGLNDHAPIYLSRHAFCSCYNAKGKYIGLDPELKKSDRLIYTEDICELNDGLTLYSCNDREKYLDMSSAGLTVMKDGVFIPDDFRHEQYLLIEEGGRRILISGCSHKGVVNIMEWFRPDVLIGGFHFMKLPTDVVLQSYAERLDGYDCDYYTCHCTGTEQYEYMKRYMKSLHYISAGDRLNI